MDVAFWRDKKRGEFMTAREEMSIIRRQLDKYIGSKVLIKANKGRKKIIIKEGVIQSTYPSIFVVKVQNEQTDSFRNVSFSYTDIITNNVELSLFPETE